MNGKPQLFISKFKISYNLLLNILSNTKEINEIKKYIEKSMINLDIVETIESTKSLIKSEELELVELKQQHKTSDEFEEYLNLKKQLQIVKPKKRKQIQGNIDDLELRNPCFVGKLNSVEKIKQLEESLQKNKHYLEDTESYLLTGITNTITIMKKYNYLDNENN